MCACMCACVCPGRGFGGEDFSRLRTCYRGSMLHSRFKGVAGVFQTGTMSTLGREVNWKSMGTSVDRSDLGLWAIIRGIALAGWPAGKHASRECLELVETERVDHIADTHLFTTRRELFRFCCEG
jgi:hypothetical protein